MGAFDASWARMFALLEKYVARERTAAVPRDHMEGGESLGRWVRKQQNVYRGVHPGGRLTKRQITKLVALPGWSWSRGSEKWERGYRALVAFQERERHIRVPSGHMEAGVNLRPWIERQHWHYKIGRGQRQGDRIARLEAIPDWKWSDPPADRWERKFAVLNEFVKREGHARVPHNHIGDGVTPGNWVHYLRFRHASGLLQRYPDRIARLEALPDWSWKSDRKRRPRVARVR